MGFKGDRTAVGKTRVESGAVIKGLDVVKDGVASVGKGGEALETLRITWRIAWRALVRPAVEERRAEEHS